MAYLRYAGLCAAGVLVWQFLTVQYNYGGNWTALFYTGSFAPVAPVIASEGTYVVRDSPGYDGQHYHAVAHDPLMLQGLAGYVDNPRLRWRRILVPGLAFILALGEDRRIDSAFFAVTLGFVFAGSCWLSRYCARYGLHPAWGICFALAPATLTSIDRMTIDVALAALTVGYAVYATGEPSWKIFPVLMLAPLARETGLCLILSYILLTAWKRQWSRTAWVAATALPYLAWTAYVHSKTARDLTVWASFYPLSGLIERTLDPVQFPLTGRWLVVAAVLDYAGVLGIWVGLVLAVRLVLRRAFGALEAAVACCTLPVILAGKSDIWSGGYEFGRTMSPLLVLLALSGIASRVWWNLLPLGMVAPRILLQLKPQWDRILARLIHG